MFSTRRYMVMLAFCGFFLFIFARLFYIQVVDRDKYSVLAEKQHNQILQVEPRRGTVFDRYMDPLAINMEVESVFCNPRVVTDKKSLSDTLAEELDLEVSDVEKKLERDKAFVWIKRKIEHSDYERLSSLNLRGVYFRPESKRKYPNDTMASHVLGFVGMDNEGLEGIELLYDKELKGRPGIRHETRDARMRSVLRKESESVPPRNGNNIILTIDSVIQYIAEEELDVMVSQFNAAGGSVIVMEPSSGKILAMANRPGYDPNDPSSLKGENAKNSAVSDVFEPGSVFKIVTASAALEEGVIKLEDKVYCENGKYKVCGRLLNDYHPYGDLSFEDVIAKSSNIGVVKTAQKLGEKKLFEYVQRFGFGEKSGIDLPGEIAGICRPPEVWSRSDITTIPMGQGIAVTSIQLAGAISVIANGGYLVKPYVVEEVTTWEGEQIKKFLPEKRRMVISPGTCDKMKRTLRRVVTDGTGKQAMIKRYETCGKTGTAQMVSPAGGYYPDKYYAVFVGFAPRENPLISVVVVAKDPRPQHFGGTVAGPTFRKIAERTLEYLGAPETE
nr:penicillin-binding transpeptidase domain-containing protein [Candidatus Omnitrophota bacterium]